MATKKARLGNQNPTQSVILPYEKSLYRSAIRTYQKSKRKAQKWQVNLSKDLMAVNEDKLWVHTKFGYSLPRRNGKNEVVVIRELYGLEHGEQILHTAHRTTTSHSSWERLKKIIEMAGYQLGEDYATLRATGRERIVFLKTGGTCEFRTRTGTGGLGEGFDLLVVDEAQEYTTEQESALKYVVTDSKNPQTIFCGTPPTPLSSGTVFVNFRNDVLAGKIENAGWAEWGVEKQSDVRDRELWYLCNPSLGSVFTERSVQDEVGSDEIDFNIQRLGLWIKYNQKSAISENEWRDLKVKSLPKLDGPLYVGIKYGNDGTNVALSIAVKTADKKIFVESIDCQSVRNGSQWIINFLKKADVAAVVIDGAGGQNILAAEMKDFKIKITPVLPTVKEIIVANSSWEQGIYQQTLCHADQPSLTQVVTNCEKRNIGTNGGFGYKSQFDDMDISLMDSALLAHWVCNTAKPKKKQQVRY